MINPILNFSVRQRMLVILGDDRCSRVSACWR